MQFIFEIYKAIGRLAGAEKNAHEMKNSESNGSQLIHCGATQSTRITQG
jgi:hypothetical protein